MAQNNKDTFLEEFGDISSILPNEKTIRYETTSKRMKETKQALGQSISQEDELAIYNESFKAKDREYGYCRRISKRTGYHVDTVQRIIANKSNIVAGEQHNHNIKQWQDQVADRFIVYSPGCDLLHIYDQWNKSLSGQKNQSTLPPSVVYDIRFNLKPKAREVRKIVAPYYPHRAINGEVPLDSAENMNIRKKKFPWLTDKKSIVKTFYTQSDAARYFQQQTGFPSLNDVYIYFNKPYHVFSQKKQGGWILQLLPTGEKLLNE